MIPVDRGKIITFSGPECLCRQVLKGAADRAVEISDYMAGVELWEEWKEEVVDQLSSKRGGVETVESIRSDREQAKEMARVSKKAAKKVQPG